MPTLNWIGKEAVVNHHQRVPFHLLKDVPDLACGDPGSGNLIVQGDNLVALKALLPHYAGQVKCIYIDPPYNTGNEGWAYNDNVDSPVIRRWLREVVGQEGETLDRHDRWLCMMYPRLVLLRKFLREDGAIFVNLDDNEVANCRLLMDEIFGRINFVATIAWQRRISPDARLSLSQAHDHILVFARTVERLSFYKVPVSVEQARGFKNLDDDPRGPWVSTDFSAQGWRPNQMYKITTPGGSTYEPPPGRCWSNIENEFEKLKAQGRMWFGRDGKARPRVKTYLSESEGVSAWTWWTHDETGHNQEAKQELNMVLGSASSFDTPKPTRLLERVLQITTNPGDLILDSFAGSGTTGHAVLKVNQAASDRVPRRFILVEMEESVARNTTAERVRRVVDGYSNAKSVRVEGLGGGFRFCELGERLFDENNKIRETVRFADLARHVYFTETGEPLPRERVSAKSPLVGVHLGRAVCLLYNGILKDKSPDGGNALTQATLALLREACAGQNVERLVVYGTSQRLSPARLKRENVDFKQIPYSIRTT